MKSYIQLILFFPKIRAPVSRLSNKILKYLISVRAVGDIPKEILYYSYSIYIIVYRRAYHTQYISDIIHTTKYRLQEMYVHFR